MICEPAQHWKRSNVSEKYRRGPTTAQVSGDGAVTVWAVASSPNEFGERFAGSYFTGLSDGWEEKVFVASERGPTSS